MHISPRANATVFELHSKFRCKITPHQLSVYDVVDNSLATINSNINTILKLDNVIIVIPNTTSPYPYNSNHYTAFFDDPDELNRTLPHLALQAF